LPSQGNSNRISSTEFREVSSRVVSQELQERFAELSGDRNPMHMEALAARRTQAGLPVVHGVHSLLWALESMIESGQVLHPPGRIKAKFLRWIYLADRAVLVLPTDAPSNPRVFHVMVDGAPALTAELDYAEPASMAPDVSLEPRPSQPLSVPLNRSFESLDALSGDAFTASADDSLTLFPYASAMVGAGAVSEIAACSYIVGMEAPGLHSMFSKLDLNLARPGSSKETGKALHYEVVMHDLRFNKARIAVRGTSIAGRLDVFVRLPPIEQPSMLEVAARVQAGEFADMHALVIGGSRGLGELVAKMIAAGGGRTTITYALGRQEAEAVVGQIRSAGGAAEALRYDVRSRPEAQLETLDTAPTHLFYFATNAIFRAKGQLVSYPILEEFSQFYLRGFYDLCVALTQPGSHARGRARHLAAFYPSSIAVEERPPGMTEYAMIKAAGEQMCRDMNEHLSNLRILVARLPRLATDQTATVIPGRDRNSIDVLLPLVRETQRLSPL
jgi:NAD(P)-dependent dehydrogenase (short-subunit alcohol dehydrogenase family)